MNTFIKYSKTNDKENTLPALPGVLLAVGFGPGFCCRCAGGDLPGERLFHAEV